MDRLNDRVSFVIPAHNEAPTIAAVVQAAADAVPGAEVLVVDDGSHDDTARHAAEAGAAVLRLETNVGKGAAMRRGIEAARGDVLVFIDADGQDNPYETVLLLEALEGDVDLVLGSRFLGQFRDGAITRLNLLGTKFITLTVRALFGTTITDPLAGFRVIRRQAIERIGLQANGYDIEVDMVLRVVKTGGVVREVGASRSRREHGSSDLASFRDGVRIFRRILQVRLERGPTTTVPETAAIALRDAESS